MIQGSREWLAFRRAKIGASDAAAILGLSPYCSPFQLWLQKVEGVNAHETNGMKYGKRNEEPARQAFEEMTGLIMFGNLAPRVNPNLDWQIASLDGITAEGDCALEIKCSNATDHKTAQEGLVPPKYIPQVQHQLCVTGLDWMYYFSFHKKDGALVMVKRDQPFIDEIVKVETKFYYEYMLAKVPPPLTERDMIAREQPGNPYYDYYEKYYPTEKRA